MPRTWLFRVMSPWAKRLGLYPRSLIASSTRLAVAGATSEALFKTRLTVAVETPATRGDILDGAGRLIDMKARSNAAKETERV